MIIHDKYWIMILIVLYHKHATVSVQDLFEYFMPVLLIPFRVSNNKSHPQWVFYLVFLFYNYCWAIDKLIIILVVVKACHETVALVTLQVWAEMHSVLCKFSLKSDIGNISIRLLRRISSCYKVHRCARILISYQIMIIDLPSRKLSYSVLLEVSFKGWQF